MRSYDGRPAHVRSMSSDIDPEPGAPAAARVDPPPGGRPRAGFASWPRRKTSSARSSRRCSAAAGSVAGARHRASPSSPRSLPTRFELSARRARATSTRVAAVRRAHEGRPGRCTTSCTTLLDRGRAQPTSDPSILRRASAAAPRERRAAPAARHDELRPCAGAGAARRGRGVRRRLVRRARAGTAAGSATWRRTATSSVDRAAEHVCDGALARTQDGDPEAPRPASTRSPTRSGRASSSPRTTTSTTSRRRTSAARFRSRLAAKLRRSHFLFLGYGMADWNLRVVLERIWGDERAQLPLVGRAGRARSRSSGEFWRRRDVDLLEVALDEYIGAARAGPRRRWRCRYECDCAAGLAVQGARAVRGLRARRAVLLRPRARRRDRRREHARVEADGSVRPERCRQELDAAGAGRRAKARELAPEAAEVVVLDVWAGERGVPRRGAGTGREMYLILDQFEEYFLYHARGAGTLLDELPELLAQPRVHVLISLRDDALSRLDAFQARIPNVFANRLRHRRTLTATAGACRDRRADRPLERARPVCRARRHRGRARHRRPRRGRRRLRGGNGSGAAGRIEAPYLQLVMERVWEEEHAAGSSFLRLATLERLGGARAIVSMHLERTLGTLTPHDAAIAASALDLPRHADPLEDRAVVRRPRRLHGRTARGTPRRARPARSAAHPPRCFGQRRRGGQALRDLPRRSRRAGALVAARLRRSGRARGRARDGGATQSAAALHRGRRRRHRRGDDRARRVRDLAEERSVETAAAGGEADATRTQSGATCDECTEACGDVGACGTSRGAEGEAG